MQVPGNHGAHEAIRPKRRTRRAAVDRVGDEIRRRAEGRIQLGQREQDLEAVAARGQQVTVEQSGLKPSLVRLL